MLVNIWINQIVSAEKKLADKLIDDCTETIEKTKLVNITFIENENNYECGSCIFYIVLMIIFLTIFTVITVYLVYYKFTGLWLTIILFVFNLIIVKKWKFDAYNYIKWTQQSK